MQIQISWLLQKPTDLDLHCLQRQVISRFSRTRVKFSVKKSIFISCDLDVKWTGTIWTALKEDQPRIVHVKFGQNPNNDLGGDVV